jgi:hypothetical protein
MEISEEYPGGIIQISTDQIRSGPVSISRIRLVESKCGGEFVLVDLLIVSPLVPEVPLAIEERWALFLLVTIS